MSSANLMSVGPDLSDAGCGAASGLRPRPARRRPTGAGPSPFERLIEITRSNDLLLAQLAEARRRVAQAEQYAADPGSRAALAGALVAQACRRRGAILDRLAANRAAALALLAGRPTAP